MCMFRAAKTIEKDGTRVNCLDDFPKAALTQNLPIPTLLKRHRLGLSKEGMNKKVARESRQCQIQIRPFPNVEISRYYLDIRGQSKQVGYSLTL